MLAGEFNIRPQNIYNLVIKKYYKVTNKLIGKNQDVVLLSSDSDTEIVE
jgi:hypothetical protein